MAPSTVERTRERSSRRMTIAAALPVLLAAALGTAAPNAAAQIPLGATGPDFTKTALGGGPVSVSQYAGKVVVLYLLGYS